MGVHRALGAVPACCTLPLGGTADRLTHLSPSFSSLFWGPSCGGDRQGEGTFTHCVCWSPGAVGRAVGTRDQRRSPGSWAHRRQRARTSRPGRRGLGSPPPPQERSAPAQPAACRLPGEDAEVRASSRALKQQGALSRGGAEQSEEGRLLLELVPLPQGQLAELFGRHGEDPREVLGGQMPLRSDTQAAEGTAAQRGSCAKWLSGCRGPSSPPGREGHGQSHAHPQQGGGNLMAALHLPRAGVGNPAVAPMVTQCGWGTPLETPTAICRVCRRAGREVCSQPSLHTSSLIRSTPGGSLVLPLLVTTSIS